MTQIENKIINPTQRYILEQGENLFDPPPPPEKKKKHLPKSRWYSENFEKFNFSQFVVFFHRIVCIVTFCKSTPVILGSLKQFMWIFKQLRALFFDKIINKKQVKKLIFSGLLILPNFYCLLLFWPNTWEN